MINVIENSILTLIVNANWIVQLVILGLIIASVFSWAYILYNIKILIATRKSDKAFDTLFWSCMDVSVLFRDQIKKNTLDGGLSLIFVSGFREFSKLSKETKNADVVIEGVQRIMRIAISREQKRFENNIPYLATVGSTAPYVGLFGTVIGVMNAFRGLAVVHQSTLAAVAPGIAEALIATAIGLFTAIPAVIAFNRFNSLIEQYLANYEIFTEEFLGVLYRKLHSKILDNSL